MTWNRLKVHFFCSMWKKATEWKRPKIVHRRFTTLFAPRGIPSRRTAPRLANSFPSWNPSKTATFDGSCHWERWKSWYDSQGGQTDTLLSSLLSLSIFFYKTLFLRLFFLWVFIHFTYLSAFPVGRMEHFFLYLHSSPVRGPCTENAPVE